MKSPLETKAFNAAQLTTTTTGLIKGYAAIFGNIDEVGDVVEPGAFTKTLQEHPEGFPLLYWHDPKRPLCMVKCWEDDIGLAFEGHVNLQTQDGKDAHAKAGDGSLCGVSFGYRVVKSSPARVDGVSVRLLKELALKEITLATTGFQVNPLAQVTQVKAKNPRPADYDHAWAAGADAFKKKASSFNIFKAAKAATSKESSNMSAKAATDLLANLKQEQREHDLWEERYQYMNQLRETVDATIGDKSLDREAKAKLITTIVSQFGEVMVDWSNDFIDCHLGAEEKADPAKDDENDGDGNDKEDDKDTEDDKDAGEKSDDDEKADEDQAPNSVADNVNINNNTVTGDPTATPRPAFFQRTQRVTKTKKPVVEPGDTSTSKAALAGDTSKAASTPETKPDPDAGNHSPNGAATEGKTTFKPIPALKADLSDVSDDEIDAMIDALKFNAAQTERLLNVKPDTLAELKSTTLKLSQTMEDIQLDVELSRQREVLRKKLNIR